MFGLSAWARFWRIEAPFAMPPLIWNMMMSMAGGWFFVTLSEAISVGNTTIALPGIGSYIAVAIAQRNLTAIFYAIVAMLVVILIYRPASVPPPDRLGRPVPHRTASMPRSSRKAGCSPCCAARIWSMWRPRPSMR